MKILIVVKSVLVLFLNTYFPQVLYICCKFKFMNKSL